MKQKVFFKMELLKYVIISLKVKKVGVPNFHSNSLKASTFCAGQWFCHNQFGSYVNGQNVCHRHGFCDIFSIYVLNFKINYLTFFWLQICFFEQRTRNMLKKDLSKLI